jgi:hypothetical protein
VGETVARVHAIPIGQFGSRVGEPGFNRWSESVAHRWSQVRARSEAAGIDLGLIDGVEAGLLDAVVDVDQFVRPTLVHRDPGDRGHE